jgi:membrane-associated protease RseP (regulator of RpoE activity)
VIGVATSPIEPLPTAGAFLAEGRSILYVGLLRLLKGPIPEGMDIMLSPTAFAGWAGLLVTMINLLPVAQLDGGHVAYALLGERQNRIARSLVALLPFVAVITGAFYGVPAYLDGDPDWWEQAFAGVHWLVWFGVLLVMTRFAGMDHPPAGEGELTPARKAIAIGTLVLFVLLFMPSWARQG